MENAYPQIPIINRCIKDYIGEDGRIYAQPIHFHDACTIYGDDDGEITWLSLDGAEKVALSLTEEEQVAPPDYAELAEELKKAKVSYVANLFLAAAFLEEQPNLLETEKLLMEENRLMKERSTATIH